MHAPADRNSVEGSFGYPLTFASFTFSSPRSRPPPTLRDFCGLSLPTEPANENSDPSPELLRSYPWRRHLDTDWSGSQASLAVIRRQMSGPQRLKNTTFSIMYYQAQACSSLRIPYIRYTSYVYSTKEAQPVCLEPPVYYYQANA